MTFRKRWTHGALLGCALLVAAAAAANAGATRPQAVSPGELDRAVLMGSGCFGYSWTSVDGALAFELTVYGVEHEATEAEGAPSLSVRVPATLSWTPSLEKCLPPGRFAWVVRARTAAGWTDWSAPRLLTVRAEPTGGPPRGSEPPEPAAFAGESAQIIVPVDGAPSPRQASARPRALIGEAFSPPACTSHFADVGPGNAFCPWIEQLWRDQITDDQGCGGGNYCPKAPVTREQLALLLERSMRGTNAWRPEQGDGAVANLPPALPGVNRLLTDATGPTSITIGADGLGLIAYYNPANLALTVAHCANLSCTTADYHAIVDSESLYAYTSITVGADGFGLVSYYDVNATDLKVAHCSDIACTASDFVTSLDTVGDVGKYSSLAIGADGFGLISYYDATNQDLKVVHCTNTACTAHDAPASLDTTGGVGQYTSITIGTDGRGLISYYDDTNEQGLGVAHCANLSCSTADSIQRINRLSSRGQYTSITIGADGLALISYYEPLNGLLWVSHCSDVKCTESVAPSPTRTVLDSLQDVGQHTSITIGADGLGLISYYDATNGDLKVAHCRNIDCTEITTNVAATISLVDSAGNVGQYTSITIGSDGLALISLRCHQRRPQSRPLLERALRAVLPAAVRG